MQNAMIGYQNVLSTALFAASSGATYTGFPASNVAVELTGNGYSWRAGAGPTQSFTATFSVTAVQVVSLHRTNLSAGAFVRAALSLAGNTVYDSGLQPIGISNGQGFMVLPLAVSADTVTLTVLDTAQQQAYTSIGFVYVGPVFQPTRNFTIDSSTQGSKPQVDGFTSRNGLNFPQYRYRVRTLKLSWSNFLLTEMLAIEAIVAFADTARNMLVIPQPDVPTTGLLPVYGQGSATDRGIVQGGYRSTTFSVTERL